MRLRLLTVCLALAVASIYAQVPTDHNLKLAGNRFAALTWGHPDAETENHDRAPVHRRAHGAGGPFNVFLRAPELGQSHSLLDVVDLHKPPLPHPVYTKCALSLVEVSMRDPPSEVSRVETPWANTSAGKV